MPEQFTGDPKLTNMTYKSVQDIQRLLAELATPKLYWKPAREVVKKFLARSNNRLRLDPLYNIGVTNILAVLTPSVTPPKGVSDKLMSATLAIANSDYAGGYLYEAACLLKPGELVDVLRRMPMFKHYPEDCWPVMYQTAQLRFMERHA